MTTFRISPDQPSKVVNARKTLVQELQTAANKYIDEETKRLSAEADALAAILKGRTGGAGVQALNVQVASAVAKKDLADYLSPVV